jgi:putative flippase GtrA
MTSFAIATRYAFFAAVATLVNLTTQAAALRIYDGPFALTLAIALGTGSGLVTKYLLDKRWIFGDRSRGAKAHGKRFSLYTSTGVLTTAIFWGTEYAFDALTPDGRYRFVGAVIGLSIGYITKYRLDRRYVFRSAHA